MKMYYFFSLVLGLWTIPLAAMTLDHISIQESLELISSHPMIGLKSPEKKLIPLLLAQDLEQITDLINTDFFDIDGDPARHVFFIKHMLYQMHAKPAAYTRERLVKRLESIVKALNTNEAGNPEIVAMQKCDTLLGHRIKRATTIQEHKIARNLQLLLLACSNNGSFDVPGKLEYQKIAAGDLVLCLIMRFASKIMQDVRKELYACVLQLYKASQGHSSFNIASDLKVAYEELEKELEAIRERLRSEDEVLVDRAAEETVLQKNIRALLEGMQSSEVYYILYMLAQPCILDTYSALGLVCKIQQQGRAKNSTYDQLMPAIVEGIMQLFVTRKNAERNGQRRLLAYLSGLDDTAPFMQIIEILDVNGVTAKRAYSVKDESESGEKPRKKRGHGKREPSFVDSGTLVQRLLSMDTQQLKAYIDDGAPLSNGSFMEAVLTDSIVLCGKEHQKLSELQRQAEAVQEKITKAHDEALNEQKKFDELHAEYRKHKTVLKEEIKKLTELDKKTDVEMGK